ncbi:MAG: PHP domain-containing protein [Clostridia bacterium]|nr:PHP domain-containing protein [Clostridia bacterium]
MTARELVRHAKECGLSAVAVTDHDSVDGVADALDEGERIGIEVIPAIELSAQSDTETHILGYFIDINDASLREKLQYAKTVRCERQNEICQKLNALGFALTMDEVRELAGSDILCRAHFARLMVKKGYVSSVKQAFDEYLANGRPAFSGREALTDAEAVRLINGAGGMAFCAHLHLTRKPPEELEKFLLRLKSEGLAGIEGYYTEYTPQMQKEYLSLAKKLGLCISGGTDFHGAFKPHISIGKGLGDMSIPYSVLKKMKKAYAKTKGEPV